jgi:hypothetical protein
MIKLLEANYLFISMTTFKWYGIVIKAYAWLEPGVYIFLKMKGGFKKELTVLKCT